MWIKKISIENIKGFVGNENTIDFSKNINLLVGHNNAGKSVILNAILNLQNRYTITPLNITIGKNSGYIDVYFENYEVYANKDNELPQGNYGLISTSFERKPSSQHSVLKKNSASGGGKFGAFYGTEPSNLIYPYLSKRKVTIFDESVNIEATNSVTGDFKHLSAKIARLSNLQHPNSSDYQQACKDIIGFPISTVASEKGQKVAYLVNGFDSIPLEVMGEGIPNLLGLIVDLCIAENNIFLIEEIENDIHPQALKALLKLIEKKSANNQFIISTHSNIVTKYLGSVEGAKVFKVSMSIDELNKIPVSKVKEVPNEPADRFRLLEELGYESFDFARWEGWLILEESSAEVIIRDFLIPTFVPELESKLRTYSAGSLSQVEPKFKDFNNLFVFIHLEETYKNKAWVIIDSGDKESETITKIKEIYTKSGWLEDQFLQFSEHDFEKYYPERFQEDFEIANRMDKQEKREAKRILLEKVKKWFEENPGVF